MDLGLAGKRALVTASSGGMGLNLAHALAAEGVDLVLFSRSSEKLDRAASGVVDRYAVEVDVVAGDMVQPSDVARLGARLAELGGVDIAVLVTGRPPTPLRPTLEETDGERWQIAYDNQLASLVLIVNGVVPHMSRHENGRIITITSAHAKEPAVGHALSSVFRAGATSYMKGLATELAPAGITVNCVAPALIETPHRTGGASYTAAQAQHRLSLTPLGRMGTQEEVAAVVAFLASRQAGFVTGTTVTVDGGMSAAMF